MREKLKAYKNKFKTELLDSCAKFWLDHAVDEIDGGLINCLDRTGKVYSTDKSVWMQGRCAWTFSYLYNHIEKNEKFLTLAKSCLDFAKNHCIDEDKRMFFTVTKEGKALRKRRYWFSETFYIIGNAEYYMATGDKVRLDEAKNYYDFVYAMYKNAETDPFKITPKSYAETRNMKSLANPMIMLNVTSIMLEADPENAEKYENIITDLIEDIKAFHSDEYGAMLENVTADTNEIVLDSAPCRVVNPGHDIECAWFLLETAIRRKDEELVKFAEKVFWEAFERGWDKEYGGISYFKDLLGLPVEAYEHDMKLWWPHNETVIGALMFYLHTGDKKYFKVFEKVTKYAFKHFSDPKYGEWLGYLRRDGKPTEPPCKGHTYKGPFHVMRMLAKCVDLIEKAE